MFGFSKKTTTSRGIISWLFKQVLSADEDYVYEQEQRAIKNAKKYCKK